ncbi:hypothetical protein HBI31_061130 [Parastagonospora nodorum]|nr:hypothetical protein HBH82_032560 [Parastagonospora nodorum]KAH4703155.1 hypothetical protein HBH67_123130 [Parastagonospora nodorum]KAH4706453.1 hypothetical protein HBH78_054260 [Parastagonospora nodorum]KAH4788394.1 hypothetical protein HBH62_054920 [Parastagonospora nodorum]KAH4835214.1 hypothetical protein HBH63_017820 [Parastagonospora nodorum]
MRRRNELAQRLIEHFFRTAIFFHCGARRSECNKHQPIPHAEAIRSVARLQLRREDPAHSLRPEDTPLSVVLDNSRYIFVLLSISTDFDSQEKPIALYR